MNLAQNIKLLRSDFGWTQEDLAKQSGISLQSIKRYETDKSDGITTTNLRKLANAFGVEVGIFLKNESSPISSPMVRQKFANGSPMSISPVHKSEDGHPNLKPPLLSHKTKDLTPRQLDQLATDQLYIPMLSSTVGAGECVEIDGIEVHDTETLVPFSRVLFKVTPKLQNLRCIKLEGYSMIPMLYPDSWVIMEIGGEYKGDGLYIINFNGSFMVKLVQMSPNGALDIISVNKEYKSYHIARDEETTIQIAGKVLRCII